MTSSGTYRFGETFTVTDMIAEALERCGIFGPRQNQNHQTSALRSLNLTLADMANNQLNLWTLEQEALELLEGQTDYNLPAGTVDVVGVYRRTYTRQLGGTPASSAGGVAANAFDADFATSCTQTTANGNISYDYGDGNTPSITMVGIRSNTQTAYTLSVQISVDDGTNWETVWSQTKTTYQKDVTIWNIIPSARAARYIRLVESGGATLSIQELYFATQNQDIEVGRFSQQEYYGLPNKTDRGTPTAYFVDRRVNPVVLRIWRPTNGETTTLFYTRIRQMQDVGTTSQTVDVPYRFLEAVTASLALRMSVKYSPERTNSLRLEAAASIKSAQEEDDQRVPMRFSIAGYTM